MKYILSAIVAVFSITACHTTGTSDPHATCPHGKGKSDSCCAKKSDTCCATTGAKKKH
jgi:hypothetical protein